MVPNLHIRPEEIRIGNLIKSTVDGSIITVTDIYHACLEPETNCGWIIDDKGTFLRDCEPITLTEDWLLKFGYENTNEEYLTGFVWRKDDDINLYALVDERGVVGLIIYGHIKFFGIIEVHRFQNLFLYLTGKELD